MKKKFGRFSSGFKTRSIKTYKRGTKFINDKPFVSFFAVLGLLLTFIVISNVFGTPKQVQKKTLQITKEVQIYGIGKAPQLTLQAQIKKSGAIRITALTGGVVQNIKQEGETFYRGQSLAYLSTNYQGGNAPALQTKLAQLQYQNTLDTEKQQRDLIQKQRDAATELNEFSKETDLSKVQKDVTNLQLDLQNKTIDLTRETQLTQVQLAQVTAAMAYPSAPFNGVVESVSVKVGQAVAPGQELMVISQEIPEDPITAVAYVSADIAAAISTEASAILHLRNTMIQEKPFYITQDAVQGTLYAVYFTVPDDYIRQVTEGGHITIDLPLEQTTDTSVFPYVPIDAVYQTKEQDYVFVAKKGIAEAKNIQLGEVFGSFVEVKKGLSIGDKVILNRNVIAGDRVAVQ